MAPCVWSGSLVRGFTFRTIATSDPGLGVPQSDLVGTCRHFCTNLLTKKVNWHLLALVLVGPVGPAVTAWCAFQMRTNLVDGAFDVVANQRAVSTDFGFVTAIERIEFLTRTQHAALDQLAKRYAWFRTFGGGHGQRFAIEFAYPLEAFFRHFAIGGFALNADVLTAQHFGDCAGGTGAKERIEDHVTWVGRANQHAMQKAFWLLCRMSLVAVVVFQTLMAGADRQHPIRAHLDTFIQRFERFVVEGVFCALGFGCPNHGFMRVGKAFATEIWHWVGLAPDHIV
mmetsp:Transcript_23239/g.39975  ORF Transcript_23239/g.39975 Transcript_23239/m.39975 type:complete len:284 (-) Transcript_23239:759-1610(-)